MTSADFQTLLPEIVLAGYAMAALMVAVYTTKDKLAATLVWSSTAFSWMTLLPGLPR
jgi:NADH-quinone oxidoreductase subunit N